MDVKIFTDIIEGKALSQVYGLAALPAFAGCRIRIMPDVHAGAGCPIGFTAALGDKVVPNVVGADIGCGVRAVKLKNKGIAGSFGKLDAAVRSYVPSGHGVQGTSDPYAEALVGKLHCRHALRDEGHLAKCLGTLGGGNHFIEVDEGEDGSMYLIIHTGSRNLGKQVAEIYQSMAESGKAARDAGADSIAGKYRGSGRMEEAVRIQDDIRNIRNITPPTSPLPSGPWLEGLERELYLHDMRLCQDFAKENRARIAQAVLAAMGWEAESWFESVHNYISPGGMVRKGAISAEKGEPLIIPLNMRDGCILGAGLGNADWNCSAPHGAGRAMSRSQAKECIRLEEFEASMSGIFTTSVSQATIDESPMAYKGMAEILDNIKDTAEVAQILHPVYNFKAG